ncbi:kunitz-type serine protease inhibitor C6-like [Anolis carolinensis]|uniref:kunitz-type serine protease inhibitor C6-like n=1 Tax=Anolis carolinensis TaxID=28377 RepID=UPI002F2B7468
MMYDHILLLVLLLMGFLVSWFGPLDAYDEEETICSLPKKTGLCRAAFHRFYFNSETGQCESFTYGGCEGNANNFLTWDECFSKCEDKFICSLPRETGRCRRSFRRFYFDSKSGQCESFRYSGRGGNANNFLTQDDCVTKCGGSSSEGGMDSPN